MKRQPHLLSVLLQIPTHPAGRWALFGVALLVLSSGAWQAFDLGAFETPPLCCDSSSDCPGTKICCLSPDCTNPNDPFYPAEGTCWNSCGALSDARLPQPTYIGSAEWKPGEAYALYDGFLVSSIDPAAVQHASKR